MNKATIIIAAAIVTLSLSDGAHAQQAGIRQLGAKTAERSAGASPGAIVGARVGARRSFGRDTFYRMHGTNQPSRKKPAPLRRVRASR